MNALEIANELIEICQSVEDGEFDEIGGDIRLLKRLRALGKKVFPYNSKYYSIVAPSGRVIGVCSRNSIPDVLVEEPRATFKPISRKDFDNYGR